MKDVKYWLWLVTRYGVGPQRVGQVLEQFGSPQAAFLAQPEELDCLPLPLAKALSDHSMTQPERILADCERLGVRIMTQDHEDYPRRLMDIPDPPRVLYVWGQLPPMDDRVAIGVVGTRKASGYGQRAAHYLGRELSRGGAVVVSGLAAGIDTCALRGALEGGGTPVAVVGGGVDVPYPRENRQLYAQIAASGAVVSEYPPGTENRAGHFPVRNRIISGFSIGTVVVETDGTGGSMITADLVRKQGRDLYAVPGSMDARLSRGCNTLIQQGATAVTHANDLLRPYADRFALYPERTAPMNGRAPEPYLFGDWHEPRQGSLRLDGGPKVAPPKPKPAPGGMVIRRGDSDASDDQREILKAMGDEVWQVEQLALHLGKDSRRLQGTLTMLTINGYVREMPGKLFVRLTDTIK